MTSSLLRFPLLDFSAPNPYWPVIPSPYKPTALPLLDTAVGDFCLESNGITLSFGDSEETQYDSINMGDSACNATIDVNAVWREHPGNL